MIVRTIALFLICGASIAQDAAMVSGSEVIKVMQFEVLRPMFEYCQAAVPEMKQELSSEFASVYGKMDEAMKRFLERNPTTESACVPAAELEDLKRQISEVGRTEVERTWQHDPQASCQRFLTNARNTTVEVLLRKIEDAYARYMERTKAKQRESQQ